MARKPEMQTGTAQGSMDQILLTCSVRRIHKNLVKRVQAHFPGDDRTFQEWMALRLFFEARIQTAGDLSREFGIATGATTRLIDALEERGFIERDKKNGDRRVVLLRLTEAGAAYYKERLPDLLDCWDEVLAGWSKKEVEQLVSLFTKLEDSFSGTSGK